MEVTHVAVVAAIGSPGTGVAGAFALARVGGGAGNRWVVGGGGTVLDGLAGAFTGLG